MTTLATAAVRVAAGVRSRARPSAWLRTLPGRLAPLLAACWIELFRNIPLLVQLFLWYFVAAGVPAPRRPVPG